MIVRPVDRAFQSMRLRDVVVLTILVALSSGSLLAHRLDPAHGSRATFAEATAP